MIIGGGGIVPSGHIVFRIRKNTPKGASLHGQKKLDYSGSNQIYNINSMPARKLLVPSRKRREPGMGHIRPPFFSSDRRCRTEHPHSRRQQTIGRNSRFNSHHQLNPVEEHGG